MNRRKFITLVGGTTASLPLAARAQPMDRIRHVGVLAAVGDDREAQSRLVAFKDALQQVGWREGHNIRFDYRRPGDDAARMREYAVEMVRVNPDAIFVNATPALIALRQHTRTIPIVFTGVSDPIEGGFVESLARPGGNVTGFTTFEYSIGGKWLETVSEVAPHVARALIVVNPGNYTSLGILRTIETVAPSRNMEVTAARVRNLAEIEAAIETFAQAPNGCVIAPPDPVFTINRSRIIALALRYRLPTIYTWRLFPIDGGLLSYGPDLIDITVRAASYIDRILKGAKPAELPVQNPTKFQLIINLKTAKAIGLKIPESFLLRADEVID